MKLLRVKYISNYKFMINAYSEGYNRKFDNKSNRFIEHLTQTNELTRKSAVVQLKELI